MRDHDDLRQAFLSALLARCAALSAARLTLTAIHPDPGHPTPSRHLPLHDAPGLQRALQLLDRANALGWGAYFAVALRRPGLTRWQRGGAAEAIALPALFVDVDDPSAEALARLQCADPAPSCLVASGGGYHAYWWLDEPLALDQCSRGQAASLLRGLSGALGGDPLSVAQSLRLPGSRNTKPARANALCRVLELRDQRYALRAFHRWLPVPTRSASRIHRSRTPQTVRADAIARISAVLTAAGYRRCGDWLSGPCPFPHRHKHGDRHPSFGFNQRTGYGYCHVCGTLPLRELCLALGISSVS
jgi:hypothetical protein